MVTRQMEDLILLEEDKTDIKKDRSGIGLRQHWIAPKSLDHNYCKKVRQI